MDRSAVQTWLDAYVHAWETYNPADIAALFTEDAQYSYHPYDDEPVRGRDAIVALWVDPDNRDAPGTYTGRYEPIAIDGLVAVARGCSRYFEADGTTLKREFDNLFVIHFDESGRCRAFTEWYMRRPQSDRPNA